MCLSVHLAWFEVSSFQMEKGKWERSGFSHIWVKVSWHWQMLGGLLFLSDHCKSNLIKPHLHIHVRQVIWSSLYNRHSIVYCIVTRKLMLQVLGNYHFVSSLTSAVTQQWYTLHSRIITKAKSRVYAMNMACLGHHRAGGSQYFRQHGADMSYIFLAARWDGQSCWDIWLHEAQWEHDATSTTLK